MEKANAYNYTGIKLMVATPCYGGLMYESYVKSVISLTEVCRERGIGFMLFTLTNESLISRGRNTCVAAFLASDCTHLLFIDADITFSPDSVLRLLACEKEVCGCCYPKKTLDLKKAIQVVNTEEISTDDELMAKSLHYVVNFKPIDVSTNEFGQKVTRVNIEDGFAEVSELGTGFMMIRRDAFAKMQKAFPDDTYVNDLDLFKEDSYKQHFWLFFDTIRHPESRRYLSEDYAFCYKWTSGCNGQIWMDLMSPLNHTGTFTFKGNVGLSLMKNLKKQAPQEVKIDGQTYSANWSQRVAEFLSKHGSTIPAGRMLEVGCYEGMTTNLMHKMFPSNEIFSVDFWQSYNENISGYPWHFDGDKTEQRFIDNTKAIPKSLHRVLKGDSHKILPALIEDPELNNSFGFIYVDGDHTANGVYQDAVHSWKLLAKNGILLFDDYGLKPEAGDVPMPGIDKFISELSQESYSLVQKDYQLAIRKL
jgi:predicted O-methyltransferase YrrM